MKLLRWRALLCAGLFTLGVAPIQAATAGHQGVLTLVYPFSDGSFAVGFEASDAPACSSAGATRYMYVTPGQNGVTLDGAKNLLASVLTAFALGSPVAVTYDDSTLYCYVNRLLITH